MNRDTKLVIFGLILTFVVFGISIYLHFKK